MIGQRLKEIREKLNYKQKEFAEVLGIKPNTLSQYEHEVNEIKSSFLKQLTKEFKINSNWLLTGQGEMFIDNLSKNIKLEGKKSEVNSTLHDNIIKSLIYKLDNIEDDELLDYISSEIETFLKKLKVIKKYGEGMSWKI